MFGAILGDCVITASYDADEWAIGHRYFLVSSASLAGVEIDSATVKEWRRTDLDNFGVMIERPWEVQHRVRLGHMGLVTIGDDITSAIKAAMVGYISPYDTAKLV